jgi:hypothetical protein
MARLTNAQGDDVGVWQALIHDQTSNPMSGAVGSSESATSKKPLGLEPAEGMGGNAMTVL